MKNWKLWYDAPAKEWNIALPLGNGRMGAMIFGGTVLERISLNEDTCWYGGFRDRVNPDAKLLKDLTYNEVQERDLKVMDAAAITICRENKVPSIRVFGLDDPQNILRVIEGDPMGTNVHP